MKTVTVITLTKNINPDDEKMTKELFSSPEILKAIKKEGIEKYKEIFSESDEIEIEFKLVEGNNEVCCF